MKAKVVKPAALGVLLALLLVAGDGWAAPNPVMHGLIDGVSGPAFTLAARSDYISTPDGNSILVWGFADGSGRAQYPGPTLIVNQGDVVEVTLTNELSVPVSMVFPGQFVTAEPVSGPTQEGLLTLEAGPAAAPAAGGTVRYRFTASHPGTYLYQSGTRPDLQVEMGLVGALIVRPAGFDPMDPATYRAYDHPASTFSQEYLFLLTEMDATFHRLVELGLMDQVDTTTFLPTYWFLNGRCSPDTMFEPYIGWLPTQPYNSMPMMYPGEKVLMRVVGAGRDLHPFHHHGNHARVIAMDGRLLDSGTGSALIDLSYEEFTVQTVPGQTVDAIFTWTGEGMGWDIYGHAEGEQMVEGEDPNDHGKPFPVLLPENLDLAFGGFYSGSPFLGGSQGLPPGEGGLNPTGGFVYMWHSHNEKELTNNNIFPGGLMTMMVVMSPMSTMQAMSLERGVNPIMGGGGR
jgi:hypothetical protein